GPKITIVSDNSDEEVQAALDLSAEEGESHDFEEISKEESELEHQTEEKVKYTTTRTLTLPLDILFEDNLNLLKTSKLFRETLSSPRATTVWKEARERDGAPDPPSFMSEIGWAVLLYRASCQQVERKMFKWLTFLCCEGYALHVKNPILLWNLG
ncbi:hypothetical protein CPB84DRAFT_1777054, partial [Gymnopilus junonius]